MNQTFAHKDNTDNGICCNDFPREKTEGDRSMTLLSSSGSLYGRKMLFPADSKATDTYTNVEPIFSNIKQILAISLSPSLSIQTQDPLYHGSNRLHASQQTSPPRLPLRLLQPHHHRNPRQHPLLHNPRPLHPLPQDLRTHHQPSRAPAMETQHPSPERLLHVSGFGLSGSSCSVVYAVCSARRLGTYA
jgi:hypothetical protein